MDVLTIPFMSLGDDVGDGDGWDWEGGPLNSRADAFNYATGSKQKKEGDVETRNVLE